MSSKETGDEAARSASKTLKDDDTAEKSKDAAGSTLTQKDGSNEKTSDEAAKAASKTLRDGRTSEDSKSAAGSALSQKEDD